MTATEILKMIETVSPDDTAKLDEIDARVWCLLNKLTFECFALGKIGDTVGKKCIKTTEYNHVWPLCAFYTRSRDALKAIRPEGWESFSWREKNYPENDLERANPFWGRYEHKFTQSDFGLNQYNVLGFARTEELAELHAIIQAIEFERTR